MRLAAAEQKHVTDRWLEVEGELRAALLRACMIIAFYSTQLVNFLFWDVGNPAAAVFHRQATYLSAGWLFVSLAIVVMISRQKLPPLSKYLASAVDILLLTLMACAGTGPSSPLVLIYLLIVLLAGLRGSLRLIWLTTLGSMLAFVGLLMAFGHFSPAVVQSESAARPLSNVTVAITLLAIGATGIITGQLVRMLKQIVSEIGSRYAGEPAQLEAPATGLRGQA